MLIRGLGKQVRQDSVAKVETGGRTIRYPLRLFSMWLSSVVFPAPRKPLSTVTGSVFFARCIAVRTALYGLSASSDCRVIGAALSLQGASDVLEHALLRTCEALCMHT